jgi:hypothetical protein
MNAEADALATFHRWANNRRRQPGAVEFLARLWAAWVLLTISGTASRLARIVVPMPRRHH